MSDAPTPPPSTPPESSPPDPEAASAPEAPPETSADAPIAVEAPAKPEIPPPETSADAPTAVEAPAKPEILPREPAGPPGKSYFWGTGRRKRAIARVRVRPGDGTFKINGREVDEYFHLEKDRQAIARPLEATETRRKVDVFVNVHGGGTTGQTGAVALGIARALMMCNPAYEPILREGHFLTRDARKVERKKYGQRGARRRFQFSKR